MITFENKDKTKLHGWFVPAIGKAEATAVHFHGNAQNLSAYFSFVKWLPEQGFNPFLFDSYTAIAKAHAPDVLVNFFVSDILSSLPLENSIEFRFPGLAF